MKMKKIGFVLALVALAFFATTAGATRNANGKWALHDAGAHDSKAHTCSFVLDECSSVVVDGPSGPGRDDIYIIAVDVAGIAGTRYGLTCDGPLFFYGWTKCTDFEIPTENWPGCGEANAQTWTSEQAGPHVTIGILDVYFYAETVSLSVTIDPRVGFAEWCDGSEPSPICVSFDGSDNRYFGIVGFNGNNGFNPCGIVPVQNTTWGQVKALYR